MNNGHQPMMQVFNHIVQLFVIGNYQEYQVLNHLGAVSNFFGMLFLDFIQRICHHQERKQIQIYVICFVHHALDLYALH
jgi:hypothetical protein